MVERRSAEAEAAGTPFQATVLITYLEIYQEKMFDLLVSTGVRSDLHVRIHPVLGPHVPSLTETPVKSSREVLEILDYGTKNRAVGATSMNANSSRSHAVFTVDLRLSYSGVQGKDLQSKIHFVDLAGSEKTKKAQGERMQEGIAINQSLATLSRVIQVLTSGEKGAQPPFRESKLTVLLRDALMGNSRTVLLACISPSRCNLEESVTTLEFAARCKLVKTTVKKNVQDKQRIMESLSAQKRRVEAQLCEEMSRRQTLQEELEREIELSRRSHEEMKRMKEEKEAFEQQLRVLESYQEGEDPTASLVFAMQRTQLLQAEEEIKLMREAHEVTHQARDKLHRDFNKKAKDLERLQRKLSRRAEEQRSLREEASLHQQAKEEQVRKTEEGQREALEILERERETREIEKAAWAEWHRQNERRVHELEAALREHQTDRAERSRLELEREEILRTLRCAREEQEAAEREAERVCNGRMEKLRQVEEERQKAVMELAVVRQKNEAQQLELKQILEEKERLADELQKLSVDEADKLKRAHREAEEREDANRIAGEIEAERVKKEKEAELSQKEAERRLAVMQMQEKLQEMRLREEQAELRAQEVCAREVEVRQRIEQEARRREAEEEELRRELRGLHCLSESWTLERRDLERKAEEQRQRRDQMLRELGIMGAEEPGIENSREAPRLVNLHPDPLLEGCLVYYLPEGETRIGADQQSCRVWLEGLEVGNEVCAISRSLRSGSLSVRSLQGGLARVNGIVVREDGHALADGDRLTIGRAHIFRVVVPTGQRRIEIERDEREFDQAMRELQDQAQVDPRWRRGVDAAILTVKRDYGTREASALLDAAKSASDAVAEANALLRLVPEEWTGDVSHYELAVLFDADSSPTVCVLGRRRGASAVNAVIKPRQPNFSVGIWEASRFVAERLSFLHQAAERLRMRLDMERRPPDPLEEAKEESRPVSQSLCSNERVGKRNQPRCPGFGDWESIVWSEVSVAEYRELARRCVNLQNQLLASEGQSTGATQFWNWWGNDLDAKPPTSSACWSTGSQAENGEENKENQSIPLPGNTGLWSWLSSNFTTQQNVRAEEEPTGRKEMSSLGGVGLRLACSELQCVTTDGDGGASRKHKLVKHDVASERMVQCCVPGDNVSSTKSIHSSGVASGRCTCADGALRPKRCLSVGSLSSAATAVCCDDDKAAMSTAAILDKPAKMTVKKLLSGRKPSVPASVEGPEMQGPSVAINENTRRKRVASKGRRSRSAVGGTLPEHGSEEALMRVDEPPPSDTKVSQEIVDVRVGTLFDGRLGVRLKAEGLVVCGFDVPAAAEMGWRVRDEILAVNDQPVRTKDDFGQEVARALLSLPINFTVRRALNRTRLTDDACTANITTALVRTVSEVASPPRCDVDGLAPCNAGGPPAGASSLNLRCTAWSAQTSPRLECQDDPRLSLASTITPRSVTSRRESVMDAE
eukprot:TRINITY_DN36009_c0_g1_i1.p1 TRINITY_DN36009_c0_g1~~TRINITY_DN36009_c0_g1_i1.p1  ORF type:complete len:1652 (+),score=338.65 TRINITY_DN36009_c0_g1_i1:592-4956(+)